MHDNDPAEVKVVDRRQSSQTAEETVADSTAPETNTAQADAPPAAEPNVSSAEPERTDDPFADDADPFGMPDPALLVAMAGMQTTTPQLLALLLPAIDSQARRALGLLADPQTGELLVDLNAAQIAIDAIQFLLGKTEATLQADNYREMQRRLNDLRLNFVAKR